MFFAGTSAPQFVFLIDFKIVVGDIIVGIFLISAILLLHGLVEPGLQIQVEAVEIIQAVVDLFENCIAQVFQADVSLADFGGICLSTIPRLIQLQNSGGGTFGVPYANLPQSKNMTAAFYRPSANVQIVNSNTAPGSSATPTPTP